MISPGLPANFSHNAATLGIFGPAGMQNRHHHHHAYGALDGSAGAAVLSVATGGGSHLHNSLQGSSGIPGLAATSGGLHVGDMQTAFEQQQQQQRRDHYFASGIHEHHLVKREDVRKPSFNASRLNCFVLKFCEKKFSWIIIVLFEWHIQFLIFAFN